MNIKESVEYLLSLFSTNKWDEPLNKAIQELKNALLQSCSSLLSYDYLNLKQMIREEIEKTKTNDAGIKRLTVLFKIDEQIDMVISIVNNIERYDDYYCQPNTGDSYPIIWPNNFQDSASRFDDAIDLFFDANGHPLPSTIASSSTPIANAIPIVQVSTCQQSIGFLPTHNSSVANLNAYDSPALCFRDELFGLNLSYADDVKRRIVPFGKTSFSFGIESLSDYQKIDYYNDIKRIIQAALENNKSQEEELEKRRQMLLSVENIMLIFQRRLIDKQSKVNNLEQTVKSLRLQIEEIDKTYISPQIAVEFSRWNNEKEDCLVEYNALLEKKKNSCITDNDLKRIAYLERKLRNKYGDATLKYKRIRNAILSRNFDYIHLSCSLARDESLLKGSLIECSKYLIDSSKHQLLIRDEIERKYDEMKRVIKAENSKLSRFLRKMDESINACRASYQKRKVSNF